MIYDHDKIFRIIMTPCETDQNLEFFTWIKHNCHDTICIMHVHKIVYVNSYPTMNINQSATEWIWTKFKLSFQPGNTWIVTVLSYHSNDTGVSMVTW